MQLESNLHWTKLSPLHVAAIRRSAPTAMLALIEDAGAEEADAQDRWGRTVFHIIAEENLVSYAPYLSLMIKRRKEPKRDVQGRTPVHLIAKFNCSPKLLEGFIQAGDDIRSTCSAGLTPLDYALANNCDALLLREFFRSGAELSQHQISECFRRGQDTMGRALCDYKNILVLCSLASPLRRSPRPVSSLNLPAELIREVCVALRPW